MGYCTPMYGDSIVSSYKKSPTNIGQVNRERELGLDRRETG
jgi:hypothetical protein